MVKTAIAHGGEMLKAANDNGSLTVANIVRGNRTARVYNFEVESRAGEITNNYFVGDAQAWVHNMHLFLRVDAALSLSGKGGYVSIVEIQQRRSIMSTLVVMVEVTTSKIWCRRVFHAIPVKAESCLRTGAEEKDHESRYHQNRICLLYPCS